MRDILIVSIVAVASIMSLRRPWIGVMLWTWLSVMNPHRFTWGFVYDAPLAAISVVVTLLGMLLTSERKSPFQGTPVTIFALFAVWVCLSWAFGVDSAGDYYQWTKVMKIYFMTFIAIALLHTKNDLLAFAWVATGSLAILGAKGGIFTILHGGSYRVWGPPDSFIEDNNEFALALIMTIPLLHFLQLQITRKWLRYGVSATIFLCAASALGSHSRGGLIAITAMVAVFWWRSPRKGPMTLLIIISSIVLLPMMPEEWWQRMDTISEYGDDQSAQGRLYAWHVASEVAKHYFFGAGMSYQHESIFRLYGTGGGSIAAHSIYFQILGNHGFVGLLIFLLIWFSTFSSAAWLRTNARHTPQAVWAADLGSMVQVSLIAYAVGGAFLSLSYFDLPYIMMVLVVLARKWVENRSWESEPSISFLEYSGLRKSKFNPIAAAATKIKQSR